MNIEFNRNEDVMKRLIVDMSANSKKYILAVAIKKLMQSMLKVNLQHANASHF